MKNLISKITTWSVALFFIAGIGISSLGDVLCISDNGHIKVESFCNPCCEETTINCQLLAVDIAHEHHDDCSDCDDFSLESPKLLKRDSYQTLNFSIALSHIKFIDSNQNILRYFQLSHINSLPNFKQNSFKISTTVLIC